MFHKPAFVLLILIGSATASLAMGLDVQWGPQASCSGQAPAVKLSGVPQGTTKLDFKMVDLDLPTYNHGGGTIDFTGKASFAAGEIFGTFSSYRGPCPPPETTHRYEWTVQALDASGKVLGSAKVIRPFKR